MREYYNGMIEDVKSNYEVLKNSSLEELIVTFYYFIDLKEELESKIDNAIKELNIGINTYNGRGSRTALFECIDVTRNILMGDNDD